jgi:hypothetical protein
VLLNLDGKRPKRPDWQKTGFDAPELAAGKWSEWGKRWNLGVLLGASGVAVVEIDSEPARLKLLDLLDGELPAVPIVETGRGFWHLYYADRGHQNAARDGIELRAGRQQCVLPPSIHPDTGKPYVWLPGHEPWLS